MSLVMFPVTGTLKAIISDSSADVDGTPDTQLISSTVWFTPDIKQVYTADGLIRLQPIRARTNPDDGQLKTIDGHAVSLVANVGLGLDRLLYTVSFTDIVYDRQAEPVIQSFVFEAPTDTTSVDLATVPRVIP